MRVAYYLLITSVVLGVIGFAVATLLDKKQLGMAMFLVGFFIGAGSAIFLALTSANADFGKLGTGIKIAAGGFGLIVLGQLAGFALGRGGSIENILFFLGMAVMMVGIVVAAFRIAKF